MCSRSFYFLQFLCVCLYGSCRLAESILACLTPADTAHLTTMARHQLGLRASMSAIEVGDWTDQFLHGLRVAMPALLDLDLAPATRVSYSGHVNQYRLFCERTGKPLRPDAAAVAEFILGRALMGYKMSTIELGVYALAKWAAEQYGVGDLLGSTVIKRALKAAPRLVLGPQSPLQKLPISWQLLSTIVSVTIPLASSGAFVKARDTALLLVGWQGMFRSSELIAMRWENIHFTPHGVMIFVPESKTDPSEGAWVFLADATAPTMRVSLALRALRLLLGRSDGPVFTGWQQHHQPMSKTTVGVRVRHWLAAAGVRSPDLYAAHSLRRGGATHAAQVGIPVRFIMTMGRWKSDSVRQYLYNSPSQLFQQSQLMVTMQE